LLLLCNDNAVLGPWVNGKKPNVYRTIVGILIFLSVILTASVLFPNITGAQIEGCCSEVSVWAWALPCTSASRLGGTGVGLLWTTCWPRPATATRGACHLFRV
jgi:hypothetical protein